MLNNILFAVTATALFIGLYFPIFGLTHPDYTIYMVWCVAKGYVITSVVMLALTIPGYHYELNHKSLK